MSELSAGRDSRWYQSLDWTQWKALIASNLGWTFDGFEVFALILTVGAALHELLDPSEYGRIPVYRGGDCNHGVRLGRRRPLRRHSCRLYRPQALNDSYDPRLFRAHGLERAVVELVVLRRVSLPCRARDRLGMGHRRIDHGRALAGPHPRQRRRFSAIRLPDRQHSSLRRLGRDRRARSQRLALYVSGRRSPSSRSVLDPAQYSGITALGAIEQAAA